MRFGDGCTRIPQLCCRSDGGDVNTFDDVPRSSLPLVVSVLDVFGDPVLERLELVVQLIGRDRLAGLGLAHEPGRGVHGGAPRRLLGVGVGVVRLVGGRLDLSR